MAAGMVAVRLPRLAGKQESFVRRLLPSQRTNAQSGRPQEVGLSAFYSISLESALRLWHKAPMLLVEPQKSAAKEGGAKEPPQTVTKLEVEVICMFVQLSRALGQPRSYAEIYGLIFISAHPLTLEDVIARLGISRGSASQGLKFLRDLGAIKIIYIPGDRSIHYEAVAQLRLLVTRFLQKQVFPHFDSSRERLDAIDEMVKELPPTERAHVSRRINTLRTWANRTERLLPLLMKILEP